MADTLIQTLLDKDYQQIKTSIMKVVDNKIKAKIEERKSEVLQKINSSK